MKIFFLFLLPAITIIQSASANNFPATLDFENQKLILNGTGLRKAYIFIKVYRAGLYLVKRSTEESEILNSKSPKILRIVFLRDVESNDANTSFRDAIEKNFSAASLALNSKIINEFLKVFQAIKENDTFTFLMSPKKVDVQKNGEKITTIESEFLAQNLLKIWLGKPPNEELKSGLLSR